MKIIKERTRLMFIEYTELEERQLDDLVGTMDKVFAYKDPDGKMIAFPTGMEESVKKTFPKIPIEDKSKTYWDYAAITPVQHNAQPRNQLQIDFIEFVIDNANKKRNLAGILSPGTGKAQPLSTKIPTPNGYKLMGDIKVGDKVFGSNGQPITVTGVFPQGVKDIYEITFNDGRKAQCCKEHLWNVYHAWTSIQKTVSVEDMLKDFKKYTASKDDGTRDPYIYKYRIPLLSSPVEYECKPVPIDPYVLGVFLGDGCCKDYPLTLSSTDEFIPNKIARICGFMARKSSDKNHNYIFYKAIKGKGVVRISTKEFFKNIKGIRCNANEKRIPDEYMYNSLEVRMELLRGLMDTDGCITYADGRFNVSFNSSSPYLLDQVRQLILGLGFNANISFDNRFEKYRNSINGEVAIRVPQKFKQELFSLPRKVNIAKQAALRSDHQQPFKHLLIKDIKLIKQEEAQCIMVDADDHLYITEDFIVTHNTFMACYSAIKMGLRTLIIVPTSGIKAQWGETLTGMFNVPEEKVKLVNSPKDFINVKADFVIVSQASLAVLNKTYDLEKIMKHNKFGIKVIDEVQMWFHNIIKVDANSNIANNWYLTGTFGRSGDEENALYQEMFGDLTIFREKEKNPTLLNRKPGNVYGMKPHMHVRMMWGHSGLSKESIAKVSSTMRYSERSGKWMRYGLSVPAYTELIIPSDGTPTKFLKDILSVVKMANNEVKYGKMLILSATIASCNVLLEYVQKIYPNKKVGTINSRNSKAENDRIKAECDILISTVKSAGTGFDVKDLSKLIVVEPFKSWILADQVSGRLRRRPDGKDTYMWDIVDAQVPQLRAWANARADVLRRKSKSFKVIDL